MTPRQILENLQQIYCLAQEINADPGWQMLANSELFPTELASYLSVIINYSWWAIWKWAESFGFEIDLKSSNSNIQ